MLGEAISSLPLRLSVTGLRIGLREGCSERATRLVMGIKLYGTLPSPPSHSVRLMLEAKGLDYKPIWLLPGLHPALLRTRGFRGGTVPALKIDGRRVQRSLEIARALDQLQPEPPLLPADPEKRRQVEEAERWADEVLQDVPRRIVRW